ncbi:MAG: hypothetical protein AB7U75_09330 [Hyphomicrobiaceae bacterium]
MKHSGSIGRFVGLATASGFPATFWPLAVDSVGAALGYEIATPSLIVCGCSIALFLLPVSATVMSGEAVQV